MESSTPAASKIWTLKARGQTPQSICFKMAISCGETRSRLDGYGNSHSFPDAGFRPARSIRLFRSAEAILLPAARIHAAARHRSSVIEWRARVHVRQPSRRKRTPIRLNAHRRRRAKKGASRRLGYARPAPSPLRPRKAGLSRGGSVCGPGRLVHQRLGGPDRIRLAGLARLDLVGDLEHAAAITVP